MIRRTGKLIGGVALLALGCTNAAVLRGQVDGLRQLTAQAGRNGAVRCAPRELALAEAHLAFAELELDQGFSAKARHHLTIAEPNAHAAMLLSPPEHCTDRQVIEEAPPPPVVEPPPPGDRDGDGYLDPEDGCPELPENYNGFKDVDGCPDDPDTDGDGLADSVDLCVLEPEDRDGTLDADGCPELDNDADGLLDLADKCPVDPEDPDGYEDADGCPDLDNDADVVPDLLDQCPNTPGSKDEEPLGCPSKPALVVVTDCEVRITQQIHFEFNKDKIRPESFPVLDAVVEVLVKNPSIALEVQGHTDNKGGADYNRKLSDRRAASVVRYLTSHGVAASRLASNGYGLDRPIVPNDSDRNRSLNRRVQFVRTEGGKSDCGGAK